MTPRLVPEVTSPRRDPVMLVIVVAVATAALVLAILVFAEDRMRVCRKTQAGLGLNTIARRTTQHFARHGEFPRGRARTLPPWPCCGSQCGTVPATAWAADPIWSALDFGIDDPMRYQFAYASDGTTVRATATRDADCNGVPETHTLELAIENGVPRRTFTAPEPAE